MMQHFKLRLRLLLLVKSKMAVFLTMCLKAALAVMSLCSAKPGLLLQILKHMQLARNSTLTLNNSNLSDFSKSKSLNSNPCSGYKELHYNGLMTDLG